MRWYQVGAGVMAALAGSGAWSQAATKPAAVKTWDVPTRHLVGGAQGDVGYQVFYSAPAWKSAANAHRWAGGPAPNIPKIDWASDMVITASNGSKPTAGYNIRITGVQRVGPDVVVRVRETRPAADAITAQVITYPSDAVAVRRLTGSIQFIITTDAPEPPGIPKPAPTPTGAGTDAPAATNLAKSLFTIQQFGGIAGMNTQTIVHLFGRPLQPAEIPSGVLKTEDVEVAGPTLRLLENTVRDSGFLDLNERYDPNKSFPDQMTRVIRVQMQDTSKTVTVLDGAENVPAAFTTVWTTLQDAIRTSARS